MNQTLIDDKKQAIIKFISRPIFSYNSEDKKLGAFYQAYSQKDFDKFNDEITELVQNPKLEKTDEKLIYLCNKELKNLV